MATDVNMYVAGEWTEGSRDAAYELKSPATGEHIANIPMASQTDIDRAVAAARAAQEDFRH
ncbi:MAG: aldehyde dehydrogenase family protein, partial [Acidimicrobiia bacterium]|nr:aldehyde dehydrogenase family protein [Acidimicrobiia bacterium]